ncbi:MAG: V-type ATP synthase subunit D [Candidatus Omnitrophica bacterium 4484_171]|nr:MAG: V-type ATP synthase subunit D [Candidatus Omnitrophica bacterium 4484_171]
MAKIKLSKNELKRQKEALQRFTRFLPTLQLKKKQLQFEITKIDRYIDDTRRKIESLNKQLEPWIAVFAEKFKLENLIGVKEMATDVGSIAGVDIPVLKDVKFTEKEYDFFLAPVWVDRGIEVCRDMIRLLIELRIFEEQHSILEEEMRITTQRVNLFEKIKIPEAKENIRVIRIYLGDLQTVEVVRGKIAKAKISRKSALL